MTNVNLKFSFLTTTSNQVITLNPSSCTIEKRYSINYSMLIEQFTEELENYKNHPELIDIEEFSMNYSFGYHYSNNIDDVNSKEAMFIEIKDYLNNLRLSA